MDKQHLYYWETNNDLDFSKEDWAETDDAQFADLNIFDNSKSDDSFYSIRNNISKLPKKVKNNFKDLEQDITTFKVFESELLEPLEEKFLETNFGSIKMSRQSRITQVLRTFYLG